MIARERDNLHGKLLVGGGQVSDVLTNHLQYVTGGCVLQGANEQDSSHHLLDDDQLRLLATRPSTSQTLAGL